MAMRTGGCGHLTLEFDLTPRRYGSAWQSEEILDKVFAYLLKKMGPIFQIKVSPTYLGADAYLHEVLCVLEIGSAPGESPVIRSDTGNIISNRIEQYAEKIRGEVVDIISAALDEEARKKP